MADVSKPAGLGARPSTGATALTGPPSPSACGWLLALCLMMTVVGPLIARAGDRRLAVVAARFASFNGLQTAAGLSIAITAGSIAYGIYAGVGLWSIRPGAVGTAKHALLFGLAADALTTAIQLATAPASPFGSQCWTARCCTCPGSGAFHPVFRLPQQVDARAAHLCLAGN